MRKVLVSFVSACIGSITGIAVTAAVVNVVDPPRGLALTEGWSGLGQYALLVAVVVFPIWVLILMPCYVLVPRRSKLWSRAVLSGLGAIVGAGLVISYCLLVAVPPLFAWNFILQGAITGAVTCFTGVVLYKRFVH